VVQQRIEPRELCFRFRTSSDSLDRDGVSVVVLSPDSVLGDDCVFEFAGEPEEIGAIDGEGFDEVTERRLESWVNHAA
jgi:hypothetical protein